MKIVVDTNRMIAALVKDSTSRIILFNQNFEFITPDYAISEIQKHKNELKSKTNLNDEEFDILLVLIFENIKIIPKSDYEDSINGCKKDMDDSDDIPILALAISAKVDGIWTHDPHFKKQKKAKVFTNTDMLKLGGNK